jgi:hypothetical protein
LLKKVQPGELDFFIKSSAEKNEAKKNAFNGAFFAYLNFMQNSANSLLPKFSMLFRVNVCQFFDYFKYYLFNSFQMNLIYLVEEIRGKHFC